MKASEALSLVLAVLVAALFFHAVTVWVRTRTRESRTAFIVGDAAVAEPQASATQEPEPLRPAPVPAVEPSPIAQSA